MNGTGTRLHLNTTVTVFPVKHLSTLSPLRRIHFPTLVSFLVTGPLALVGAVRVLSYYRQIAEPWIHDSMLGILAYQPDDFFSVRYFKILASPSVVSFLYFVFRFLNRGHRAVFPHGYVSYDRDLDFRSPWVRLALLAVVNLHWVLQEWYKFATRSYPYSPLESWKSNAIVLALSGVIAFFGMRYFSFRPLRNDTTRDTRQA
jgi:hypothetical protein